MSFRKKNITIVPSRGSGTDSTTNPPPTTATATSPTFSNPPHNPSPPVDRPPALAGVRPSTKTSHPTTSTGTPTLDALLGGHSGLPLGHSLLIEEPGTTDFGGALLRYFAAEGVLQGHYVTAVGVGDWWVGQLPGAVDGAEGNAGGGEGEGGRKSGKGEKERMKIAWRYERLGEFSAAPGERGKNNKPTTSAIQRAGDSGGGHSTTSMITSTTSSQQQIIAPFCHSFDLTKRLTIQPNTKITTILLPLPLSLSPNPPSSPFPTILRRLTTLIQTTPSHTIHRILFPNLLSPAVYSPTFSSPSDILQLLHSLRALLRRFQSRVVAMFSLPTELYPRESGIVRWIEHLTDGVVEICPLQHLMEKASRMGAKGKDDVPMGVVRVWKVPMGGRVVGGSWAGGGIGMAGGAAGEDLAFTVTRKRFSISMFSLPPAEGVEGEDEGHVHGHAGGGEAGGEGGKQTKVDIDF